MVVAHSIEPSWTVRRAQTGVEIDTLQYVARPFSIRELGFAMAEMWPSFYKQASMVMVRSGAGPLPVGSLRELTLCWAAGRRSS